MTSYGPRRVLPRGVVRAAKPKSGGKLVPLGAGDPLPPLEPVTITDDDLAAASERWDSVMPKRYRGLLNAEVVNGG